MPEIEFDLDLLATHLRDKIDADKLSARKAAEEIGCSPATLSRMLHGSKGSNVPDSVNVLRAVSWLGKSVADFEKGGGKPRTTSSIDEVAAHLRALPGLSSSVAEALVAMVKAAYATETKPRGKKTSKK